MQNRDYTSKIISKLPYWFAMKKRSQGSIGRSFLQAIGLELEELFSTLDYMYEQISIDMIDPDMISSCYKAILPETIVLPLTLAEGDGVTVHQITTLRDFYNYRSNIHRYEELKEVDGYYIDEERRILYSRKDYHIFEITDSESRTVQVDLRYHKIWNYFDEIGLLLDTPRLEEEENENYLERLKDVFRNPASSTHQGLLNGIARELGIRVVVDLDDGTKDLVLEGSVIPKSHVTVNGETVPEERIVLNESGETVLLGGEDSSPVQISYIHSVEVHVFSDHKGQKDIDFENELFYSNGLATPALKKYAKEINEQCPIMWNYARWDESYWMQEDREFGYVPTLYDASIEGFRAEAEEPIAGTFTVDKSYVS